jgi:hypothetical protein
MKAAKSTRVYVYPNGDLATRHSHEEERVGILAASEEITSQEEDKYCGVRTDQTP